MRRLRSISPAASCTGRRSSSSTSRPLGLDPVNRRPCLERSSSGSPERGRDDALPHHALPRGGRALRPCDDRRPSASVIAQGTPDEAEARPRRGVSRIELVDERSRPRVARRHAPAAPAPSRGAPTDRGDRRGRLGRSDRAADAAAADRRPAWRASACVKPTLDDVFVARHHAGERGRRWALPHDAAHPSAGSSAASSKRVRASAGARLASTFARPLIWLIIIGSGFSALIPGWELQLPQGNLLPGIIGMVALFSSLLERARLASRTASSARCGC